MCVPTVTPTNCKTVRIAEIDSLDGSSAANQRREVKRPRSGVRAPSCSSRNTRRTPSASRRFQLPAADRSSRSMPPPIPSKIELNSRSPSMSLGIASRGPANTGSPIPARPCRAGSTAPRSVTSPPALPARDRPLLHHRQVQLSGPDPPHRDVADPGHRESRLAHAGDVDPEEPSPQAAGDGALELLGGDPAKAPDNPDVGRWSRRESRPGTDPRATARPGIHPAGDDARSAERAHVETTRWREAFIAPPPGRDPSGAAAVAGPPPVPPARGRRRSRRAPASAPFRSAPRCPTTTRCVR